MTQGLQIKRRRQLTIARMRLAATCLALSGACAARAVAAGRRNGEAAVPVDARAT